MLLLTREQTGSLQSLLTAVSGAPEILRPGFDFRLPDLFIPVVSTKPDLNRGKLEERSCGWAGGSSPQEAPARAPGCPGAWDGLWG